MPIYMDRHDLPGVTAKDVAEAHQKDLKIQEAHGCRALTYWFDEEREIAFCLVEAPDKDAVKAMHDQAHGLVPFRIIEVNSKLVETFLGRIEDPVTPDNNEPAIFNDPPFRVILATTLKDFSILNSNLGINVKTQLLGFHNEIIRKSINSHEGREVEHGDNGFLASFASASQAVLCALEIQKCFRRHNDKFPSKRIQAQFGLNAGIPVTENDDFFGKTIKSAVQFCNLSTNDQITLSSVVLDICIKEGLNVFGKGESIKIMNPHDEQFLNRLMELMESCWNEYWLNIHELGRRIGVSKSQLYRKMISLTGFSPSDFIKEFRLEKALKLIEKQKANISEIAYSTGFNSGSYFSKCFKKRFNILPSDYAIMVGLPRNS